MQADTQPAPVSNAALWTGYVLSALPALMLFFSAAMKLTKSEDVLKGFTDLGWDPNLALALAIVEIVCTLLYLIPQTAVLGAILLTGYLGGAVATHVRIGDHFFMPIVLGVVLWLGLYLRDVRLRAILPLRR